MNSMEMCKPILSVPFLLKVVPSNAYIAYENYSFTSLQIHAFSGWPEAYSAAHSLNTLILQRNQWHDKRKEKKDKT